MKRNMDDLKSNRFLLHNLPYLILRIKYFRKIIIDKSISNIGDSPFLDELIKLFLHKPLVWHNCYSLIMQSDQCLRKTFFMNQLIPSSVPQDEN